MKAVVNFLLLSTFLLLCGFGMPEVDKISVTNDEIKADKADLALVKIDPDYFYNIDYLRPKARSFQVVSEPLSDEMIAKSLRNLPKEEIERREAEYRKRIGEEEYAKENARLKEGEKRMELLRDVRERRLTPERLDFINQQRRLASEFCSIDDKKNIVINITSEEAAKKGISERAYQYFKEWVERMNPKFSKSWGDSPARYAYCFVYFDDNVNDQEKDVVIRTVDK